MLQDFTLTPPMRQIYLRPFNAMKADDDSPKNAIKQLWRLGNYAELTSRTSPPKIPGSAGLTLPSVFADPEWDAPKNREYQVLFWVDGRQPGDRDLAHAIRHHGSKRGKQWELSTEKDAIRCVNRWRTHRATTKHHSMTGFDNGRPEEGQEDGKRSWEVAPKWSIKFATEDEAKRFARTWDGKPFPWVNRAEVQYDSQALQRLSSRMRTKVGTGIDELENGHDLDQMSSYPEDVVEEFSDDGADNNQRVRNLDDLASRVYAEYIWT